jgi:hypothetical protein
MGIITCTGNIDIKKSTLPNGMLSLKEDHKSTETGVMSLMKEMPSTVKWTGCKV